MDPTANSDAMKTVANCVALTAVFVLGLGLAAVLGVVAVQLRFAGAWGAMVFGLECVAVMAAAVTALVAAACIAARTRISVRWE